MVSSPTFHGTSPFFFSSVVLNQKRHWAMSGNICLVSQQGKHYWHVVCNFQGLSLLTAQKIATHNRAKVEKQCFIGGTLGKGREGRNMWVFWLGGGQDYHTNADVFQKCFYHLPPLSFIRNYGYNQTAKKKNHWILSQLKSALTNILFWEDYLWQMKEKNNAKVPKKYLVMKNFDTCK